MVVSFGFAVVDVIVELYNDVRNKFKVVEAGVFPWNPSEKKLTYEIAILL